MRSRLLLALFILPLAHSVPLGKSTIRVRCSSSLSAAPASTPVAVLGSVRAQATPKLGTENERTSLVADYLNMGEKIPKEYSFKPISKNDLTDQLAKLGWGNPMFLNGRVDIATFIVQEKIMAPSSEYAYHGTSSSNYTSILTHGLDNLRGVEVHAGGAMGPTRATYSGDAQHALSFAQTAAAIDTAKPMLLRFKLSNLFGRPIFKSEVGGIQLPINANSLEYSLDEGMTWLKFTEER